MFFEITLLVCSFVAIYARCVYKDGYVQIKFTRHIKILNKMVCVPCVAVPILLIIWRFLIQPLVLKWWYFIKSSEADVNKSEQPSDLVTVCKNGVCTLAWTKHKKSNEDD